MPLTSNPVPISSAPPSKSNLDACLRPRSGCCQLADPLQANDDSILYRLVERAGRAGQCSRAGDHDVGDPGMKLFDA